MLADNTAPLFPSQSAGTSACDPNELCLALGPGDLPCEAIIIGICVVADDVPNPCQWLLKQAGASPETICNQITEELFGDLEGGDPNDNCQYANDRECDEPRNCPDGTDCTDCNNCGVQNPDGWGTNAGQYCSNKISGGDQLDINLGEATEMCAASSGCVAVADGE